MTSSGEDSNRRFYGITLLGSSQPKALRNATFVLPQCVFCDAGEPNQMCRDGVCVHMCAYAHECIFLIKSVDTPGIVSLQR